MALERRSLSGRTGQVVKFISFLIPLYCVFGTLNISGLYFKTNFYEPAFRAIFLGLMLTLTFLFYRATEESPQDRVPWYDIGLILLNWVPTLYEFFIYPKLVRGFRTGATPLEQGLFILELLILSEAMRRTVGMSVVGITIIFIGYAYTAYLLPGLWGAPQFSWERLTEYMYLHDSGIFGFVLGIPSNLIIFFVVFGSFLTATGITKLFSDAALALAGGVRGGPAKVAIIGSAAMGMISGSASANVATVGVVTIPLMKRVGYKDYFAAGVESVASTGGIITPPVMGSIAFIIAETTGLGYPAVCLAAVFPAILYYTAIYFQLDFEAAKLGLRGLPPEDLPKIKDVMKKNWYLLTPIVILVVLIMTGMEVQEAVLYSIGTVVAMSWLSEGSRLGFRKIYDAIADAPTGIVFVVPAMAAAGVLTGSVSLTGIGVNLGVLVHDTTGDNLWALAALTWIIIYASGLAIGEIIIYIVMSIILVPTFMKLGVPILAAHMFIFYMCVASFITPPNCPPVFVSCSIAGSTMWKTGFAAMKLGVICFIMPFLILFDPVLITHTPWSHLIVAMATAISGSYFLAAGIEGWMLGKASGWQRILFLIGGLGLFVPGVTTKPAAVLLVFPILAQVASRKKAKKDGEAPLE